jgi:hypothetical protein
MPRVLDRFPDSPMAKYPWDEWLDGRVWELTPGEDFAAKPSTFRANAQLQAKKRGGSVRVRTLRGLHGKDRLVLQFVQ